MRRPARRTLAVAGVLAAVAAGGGAAVAAVPAVLEPVGPVSVAGTEAHAAFAVADREVRQVRYADQGVLRYTFELRNGGRLPVTVLRLAPDQADPRLFDLLDLSRVDLAPGETGEVTLSLRMSGCETLSARAGSFVSRVVVVTRRAGLLESKTTLELPEEIHTGSPREASCPGATAGSRPRG